jgi:CheY-like chemotaxis protein
LIEVKTLSGTILVADDDADIRDILRDTLNTLGARVVTAEDGRECLDRITQDVPDVLLLDIEMPIKSGLQVCRSYSSAAMKRLSS